VLSDIASRVAKIQDPLWTEAQIRDINDDINRLLRLKNQWERRITELGGKDMKIRGLEASGQQLYDKASSTGYRYFGRAKDLPGVRELLEEQERKEPVKKTRGDLIKAVDAEYYGYHDEDDGVLVDFESQLEFDEDIGSNGMDPVPSMEQVEQHLLEQRKQQLLQQFLSK
jgi:pre-mRNA-splicing factor ISY1